jgi:nucleoid-associated protein YgaU
MWSADLGNGNYGGLQMSPQIWQQFGGTEYAPTPDLASRSQQIAIAEKVLAAKGPSAWAGCADIAGLTVNGATADVDPGTTPSPLASVLPGVPEGSVKSTDAVEPVAPTGKTTPDAPAATTQESGTVADDAETGKHRGTPEQTTEPGNTDEEEREAGRHASRGDATAREGAPDAGESAKTRSADSSPGVYTVRPGDSLWAIADAQELPGGWSAVFEANRETLGDDPDLILPGQSLDLGAK